MRSGDLCATVAVALFSRSSWTSPKGAATAVITGFRQTRPKIATADVRGDWYIIFGECGQNGVVEQCKEWGGLTHMRYRTSDGGRHWRALTLRRHVDKWEGSGPENPSLVGSVDDEPPATPCSWHHSDQGGLADGVKPGFRELVLSGRRLAGAGLALALVLE